MLEIVYGFLIIISIIVLFIDIALAINAGRFDREHIIDDMIFEKIENGEELTEEEKNYYEQYYHEEYVPKKNSISNN